MDEKTFQAYMAAFNAANYDGMFRYYADDVTFSFANGITLEGTEAIRGFYEPLHAAVDETVEPTFVVIGDRHIAVELNAQFRARKDFDGLPGRSLKAGQVTRFISFVHYDLDDDDRFSEIRIGNYRALPDLEAGASS